MKKISKLHLLSQIWGIIFTTILLLTLGIHMIIGITEDSPKFFNELLRTFPSWENPILYFFIYLIGYFVIWWKPLWGSIIIITGSIFYVTMAGIDGPPIFAAPGFLVGVLYLINWFVVRRNQTKAA